MIKKKELTEGEIYSFYIDTIVCLPDGEECFRLIDPYKTKHLLPVQFYTEYGFQTGNSILCKVDKVNCNGRIFLEPVNPLYEEGKSYSFPVTEVFWSTKIKGIAMVRINDEFGDTHHIFISRLITTPEVLECRVTAIKKGKLQLSLDEDLGIKVSNSELFFDFEVIDAIHTTSESYWILSYKDHSYFALNSKDYQSYGIEINATIRGRFVEKYQLYVEPEHPKYTIGQKYPFKYMNIIETNDKHRGLKKFMIVHDSDDNEFMVLLREEKLPVLNIGDMVSCTIVDVKKGRIILSYFQ